MGLEWGEGVNAYLCPFVSVFNDTIRGKVVTTLQYTRAVSTLKQGRRGAGANEREEQRRQDSANAYGTAYSGNSTDTRSHTTGRKKNGKKSEPHRPKQAPPHRPTGRLLTSPARVPPYITPRLHTSKKNLYL